MTDNLSYTAPGFRFPIMWGPSNDWMPDQDHGGVLMTALQYMAMQYDGDAIILLPAWPRDWNAHFTLHAPRSTTVECRIQDGEIVDLIVAPASRRLDIISPAYALPAA